MFKLVAMVKQIGIPTQGSGVEEKEEGGVKTAKKARRTIQDLRQL